MSSDVKVVSTVLYTQGSDKVNSEVEDELSVPDPQEEAAAALIKENIDEQRKKNKGSK